MIAPAPKIMTDEEIKQAEQQFPDGCYKAYKLTPIFQKTDSIYAIHTDYNELRETLLAKGLTFADVMVAFDEGPDVLIL